MADPIGLGAAKYCRQVAFECCIDVAHHIIVRAGLRAPKTYADSFTARAEDETIPLESAATAHEMVKVRNRLVHLCWEVDAGILHEPLQRDLGDFGRFTAYVYRYTETPP